MSLRDRINSRRENSYLEYISLCRAEACLGEDAKMRNGGFGRKELEAHKAASRKLGQHVAFAEVLKMMQEQEEEGRDENNDDCRIGETFRWSGQ